MDGGENFPGGRKGGNSTKSRNSGQGDAKTPLKGSKGGTKIHHNDGISLKKKKQNQGGGERKNIYQGGGGPGWLPGR